MTPEQIEELRRLEAAATPGPWEPLKFEPYNHDDALIVAMRNALPELLEALEICAENCTQVALRALAESAEKQKLQQRVAELERRLTDRDDVEHMPQAGDLL